MRVGRLGALGLFGLGGALVLVLLRVGALFVDVDPALVPDKPNLGPSADHLLGTDRKGRDLFARMVASSEAFFFPGLFSCAIALVLGTPAGALVGWWPRSRLAQGLRAVLTIVGAWPRLVLVVVVVAIFTLHARGDGSLTVLRLYLLAGVLGLSFVPQIANALAERVLYFQREQFVEAARAHGLGDGRILGLHILWANCRYLLLRQACMLFGTFILVETSLSYLGHYGVPEPRPSWGNVLADVKDNVVHIRRMLIPEAWTPSGLLEAGGRAIHEAGGLGLIAVVLAIMMSISSVLALGEHFARQDLER